MHFGLETRYNEIFENITNQLEENRYSKIRPPSAIEIKQTALMKLTINTGSFKQRNEGVSINKELDDKYNVSYGLIPACPYEK